MAATSCRFRRSAEQRGDSFSWGRPVDRCRGVEPARPKRSRAARAEAYVSRFERYRAHSPTCTGREPGLCSDEVIRRATWSRCSKSDVVIRRATWEQMLEKRRGQRPTCDAAPAIPGARSHVTLCTAAFRAYAGSARAPWAPGRQARGAGCAGGAGSRVIAPTLAIHLAYAKCGAIVRARAGCSDQS